MIDGSAGSMVSMENATSDIIMAMRMMNSVYRVGLDGSSVLMNS
jgi:hypothetical protein